VIVQRLGVDMKFQFVVIVSIGKTCLKIYGTQNLIITYPFCEETKD